MNGEPLWLMMVGVLAGVVASLLGLGGGLLMTPFLAALGMPLVLVVPTSSGAIFGTALLTALLNWRQRAGGELRIALLVTAVMVPALEFSTWVNLWLRTVPERVGDSLIGGSFFVIMLWSLWAVLRPSAQQSGSDLWPGPGLQLADNRRCSWLRLGLGGTVAGFFGGLLGIGGGRVLVPLFSGPLGLTIKSAIATSSLCILFSSAYTTMTFSVKGLIDVPTTGWLLCGSLPGAWLGTVALRFVDSQRLRRTYGELSVAAMAAIGLAQFGYHVSALIILVAACVWVGLVAMYSILRAKLLSSEEREVPLNEVQPPHATPSSHGS